MSEQPMRTTMSTVECCGVRRRDAEPYYDPPDCGHEDNCNPEYPGYSECRYYALAAMCDLDAGHDGAHEFEAPSAQP